MTPPRRTRAQLLIQRKPPTKKSAPLVAGLFGIGGGIFNNTLYIPRCIMQANSTRSTAAAAPVSQTWSPSSTSSSLECSNRVSIFWGGCCVHTKRGARRRFMYASHIEHSYMLYGGGRSTLCVVCLWMARVVFVYMDVMHVYVAGSEGVFHITCKGRVRKT